MEQLGKAIKSKGNSLLLGVTGGIASGKTVVAEILEALGAPLIDFDLLAREVVEPGKPAFKKIVDSFGKDILRENGTLDRKKLSRVVFHDTERRKKLESFTHPPIYEAFWQQVQAVTEKDPDVIIQAVVPLLIEKNSQSMFDKVLVVYVPQALQIARLVQRDSISKEEASIMLKAQLPIDDKLDHADFVVRNEGSIEETRRQVEGIWRKLKHLQRERASE